MDKLQFLNDRQLPFAKVLGLKFTEASELGVKAEMLVRPELCTRPDILHGGAVMAFADTLGAAATTPDTAPGVFAAVRSTESRRDTPRSCIVTPYNRSMRAMVSG